MAYSAHFAYQYHNIMPGIFLGIRTINDKVTEGELAFMRASDIIAVERGEIALKVNNFAETKGKE